jgi:Putative peptidoglycan binding domain
MIMQTLQLGSSGGDVVTWQEVLGMLPDGQFGPKTREETMTWQKAHGISPDGVVGPATWAAAGYGVAPVKKDVYQTYVPQPGDYGYVAPKPPVTGTGTRVTAPTATVPKGYAAPKPAAPKLVVPPVVAPPKPAIPDSLLRSGIGGGVGGILGWALIGGPIGILGGILVGSFVATLR